MVKRVAKDMIAEGNHEALGLVLEHIGLTGPLAECERILQVATQEIFPTDQAVHVWKGCDLTYFTVERKPYYLVTVSLKDPPGIWFKNLRLLQIRVKLGLVNSLRVTHDSSTYIIGEMYYKLRALRKVVGKEMITNSYVPRMRKPRMMTTRNRLARERNQG